MPITEAQKFAEAIRATFKTSIVELDSVEKSTKKASKSTVSRAITRKNIRGEKVKEVAGQEAKEVKGEESPVVADPPSLPPMSNFETLTLSDGESDSSTNPSVSSSKSTDTSAATSVLSTTLDYSPASFVPGSHDAGKPRGRSEHRCGRYEANDDDLEEGVVVTLLHAPRRVTFEEGIKPRMLEVHRGPLTHEGKKMYLGNDVSSASSKEQDSAQDLTEIKQADNKGKTVGSDGIGGSKRSRKVSIKKAMRQWMHEFAT